MKYSPKSYDLKNFEMVPFSFHLNKNLNFVKNP